jgi:hypothetical protein
VLDRQRGVILFECDSCDEVLDTETKDFDEALANLRRAEWSARKIGRDWIHGCPKCGVRSEGAML